MVSQNKFKLSAVEEDNIGLFDFIDISRLVLDVEIIVSFLLGLLVLFFELLLSALYLVVSDFVSTLDLI